MTDPKKLTGGDRIVTAICDGFLAQLDELEADNDLLHAENAALRKQVEGHAAILSAQSEILSRAAEKPLTRERVWEAAVQLFQHDKYAEFGGLWLVVEGEHKGSAMSCTEVTDILWNALKRERER